MPPTTYFQSLFVISRRRIVDAEGYGAAAIFFLISFVLLYCLTNGMVRAMVIIVQLIQVLFVSLTLTGNLECMLSC